MASERSTASASDEPASSIKFLFAKAEEKRLGLESWTIPSSSPAYNDEVENALALYLACERAVASAALFSANESLEDVSTAYLPYLVLDFHAATLGEMLPSTSPQSRLQILQRARAAYERFLALVDSYSLLAPAYVALHARYLDAPTQFSTTGLGAGTAGAEARRNAKISNFQAERALREKLETLRRNPRYVQEGGDEELVREVHLATVAFSVHMAFQGLESLNREEDVLSQAVVPLISEASSVRDDERRRKQAEEDGGGGPGPAGFSDRLDRPMTFGGLGNPVLGPGGPILDYEGRPLKPFTLVSSRQDIQRGVFRPGHNLPTMSIDEYLAEERRRGNFIEGGGEASIGSEEPDEEDVDKADAETVKARAWDEFKEANPRGWGNTLNRG